MRYFGTCVLFVSWGLWIGGLVAVLIGVNAIFTEFRAADAASAVLASVASVGDGVPVRAASGTAGKAAAAVFRAFGLYELAVGAAALISIVTLRLAAPSKRGTAIFVLIALAAAAAAVTTGIVTPRIDAMRIAGETQTPPFKQLHGLSMMLFAGRTLLLLIAGLLLPGMLIMLQRDRSAGPLTARDGGVEQAQ